MKTTKLGNEVMKVGFSLISEDHTGKKYAGGCHEPKGDNVVYCGDPATKLVFDTIGNKSGDSAQWCSAFVYYVFTKACQNLGIKNLVPKTASVLTMLKNSKGIFRIDKIPTAGCIAIRRSGETTSKKLSSGDPVSHAFIVYAVTGDGKQILGLEGNSDNKVKMNYYPRQESNYKIEDHLFIHAELTKGGESEFFHPFEFKTITTGQYTSYADQDIVNPDPQTRSNKRLKEFK